MLSANIHLGNADVGALVAMVDRLEPDVLTIQELTPRFAADLRAGGDRRAAAELGPLGPAPRQRRRHLLATAAARAAGADAGGLPDAAGQSSRSRPAAASRSSTSTPSRRGAARSASGAKASTACPAPDADGAPWILAGDFNATLDLPELNELLDSGYRDAG